MTAKTPLKLFLLRAVLSLCGLAAVGTVLVLCFNTFVGGPHVSYQILASVKSPNGHVEAVLTRVDAAGDIGYLVDVNSTGPDGDTERVANFYAVRRNDTEPGLDMVWSDDHALELRYLSATIARIDQSDVIVAGQHLTVALKPQH